MLLLAFILVSILAVAAASYYEDKKQERKNKRIIKLMEKNIREKTYNKKTGQYK